MNSEMQVVKNAIEQLKGIELTEHDITFILSMIDLAFDSGKLKGKIELCEQVKK